MQKKIMKIDDLWIGDLLILKKSGRIGKYEGQTDSDKVKINVNGKTIISTIANVAYAPMKDIPKIENPVSAKTETKNSKFNSLESTLDLHMEVLKPSMKNARPERIISVQITAAKAFIEQSIYAKTRKIEIIHGKGEGVLKSEVLHLLSLYDEVEYIFEKNQGGSSEVWLT